MPRNLKSGGVLTVLLIANYALDKQQSMARVADMLESGLRSLGLNVLVSRPPSFFGRVWPNRGNLTKWLGYLDKFLLFPFVLKWRARRCDLVHIVDHSNAMYRFWLGSRKTVINCNDLLAVRSALGEFGEHPTGLPGKVLQSWILAGLRRADCIACISEATRQDVLGLTGRTERQVVRVYLGLGQAFQVELERNLASSGQETRGIASNKILLERVHAKVRRPYILHVGGDTWYKNRTGVLESYSTLRRTLGPSSPDLIMIGPPLRSAGDGVFFMEDLLDEDLIGLYRNAQLLLFPSLYEGFGLPVIEAQACGCPVVTTEKPPLTEVGGEAAVYVPDPRDPDATAEKMVELLQLGMVERQQIKRRGLLNASRFSARAMMKDYLDLYQTLLAG
jgi:glycosyltransferase involved in cell wall biosynthesis